jgi:hypothetical protein
MKMKEKIESTINKLLGAIEIQVLRNSTADADETNALANLVSKTAELINVVYLAEAVELEKQRMSKTKGHGNKAVGGTTTLVTDVRINPQIDQELLIQKLCQQFDLSKDKEKEV